MMALGEYRFGMSTAAYQEFRHSAEYRWASQERLGRLPARQFVGPGREAISLRGVLHPQYKGGLDQVDQMRDEAGRGVSLLLTAGDGRAWGRWVITRVAETQRVFEADGTPRKVEFHLEIARYGERGEESDLQRFRLGAAAGGPPADVALSSLGIDAPEIAPPPTYSEIADLAASDTLTADNAMGSLQRSIAAVDTARSYTAQIADSVRRVKMLRQIADVRASEVRYLVRRVQAGEGILDQSEIIVRASAGRLAASRAQSVVSDTSRLLESLQR